MVDPWGDRSIAVKFDRIDESLEALRGLQFDGVAAVGDVPAVMAAAAAEMLGIRFHPAAAARACHDKFLSRQLFQKAGLNVPAFFRARLDEDPRFVAARAKYPCVVKPLGLSASRGVIRANNQQECKAALARLRGILPGDDEFVQVEGYIEGSEFAVEGLVTGGEFHPLAIFDKPDPLEGPFFEETIYVTPSRQPESTQAALLETTAQAVRALGLRHGPVHAELRFNDRGAWMLEAAARPIGGLCAKALRFEGGMPLEEAIIRHALGEELPSRGAEASGVMMIPIPRRGVYQSVDGVSRAEAVPLVEEVIVTAKEGQLLIPLPEGSSYLGFIFARGDSPEAVEAALRRSHAELQFHVATALETLPASP